MVLGYRRSRHHRRRGRDVLDHHRDRRHRRNGRRLVHHRLSTGLPGDQSGYTDPGDRTLYYNATVGERATAGTPDRDPVPVDLAVESDPHRVRIDQRPSTRLTSYREKTVVHVHRGCLAVPAQKPDTDLDVRYDPGRRAPVVMVQDGIAGPALVHRVTQRAVLAHAASVAPTPTVHPDGAVVDRVLRRRRPTGNQQFLANRQAVRVGNPVGRSEGRHRHLIACRDDREALSGLHCHLQRRQCGDRGSPSRDQQALAHLESIGIGDPVGLHQGGHAYSLVGCDRRQTVT